MRSEPTPVTTVAATAAAPATAGTDSVERARRRALAALESAAARPYYDAEGDSAARQAYYASVQDGSESSAMFMALSALVSSTHAPRPSYRPSELVYPWVDQHPDGRLRSIYSGRAFTARELIDADTEIARRRIERMQGLMAGDAALSPRAYEEAFDRLESELPFNCEHVVPQSWFAKREPMRGDLHHLFACEPRCNSFRGNSPFEDFTQAVGVDMTDCGRSAEGGFEPGAGKGPVARATLYFLLRYPGHVGDAARELQAERVGLLVDWHVEEPPGEYERHRNAAIFELQGNRNPLIDFPEWSESVDFAAGFRG